MTQRLGLELLGVRVQVEARGPGLEQVASLWGGFRSPVAAGPAYDVGPEGLRRDGLPAGAERGRGAGAVLAGFAQDVNQYVVATTRHLAFHAGVVALGDRVVAFPAQSGTGKSTMTVACTKLGLGYVSDEALALDDDGRVLPYPRPLGLVGPVPASLRSRGAVEVVGETLVPPAELGAIAVDARPDVVAVVVLDRRATGEPSLAPLPRAAIVTLLLRMSFNGWKDPARALLQATALATAAQPFRLSYSEALDAAPLVAGLLHDL